MSFADFSSLDQLLAFLQHHRHEAYVILFLGAFLETVIPFSLIVLGEVVFLSGSLLAGMGVLDLGGVMAALYIGGILGDNASYWMGHYYGAGLFERLAHWPLIGRLVHPENYDKGVEFFRKRGALAVFTARLSGPLSWVTPAMAGIFRLNYLTFLRFNTPAVIIGISEFVIIGYFFGNHIDTILAWMQHYALALGLIVVGVIALVFIVRRYFNWRAELDRTEDEIVDFISRHFGLSLLIIAVVIIGVLYLIRSI
jgi:membrane-associated protein